MKGHMKAPTQNAYLRTKILTANPAELRAMLLDGAIRFAEQARTGLLGKDFEACYVGVTRCQSILMELINGLRPEHDPELCKRLSALYTFMYIALMKASSQRDVAGIDQVIQLLQFERETWNMLLEQLAQENMAARAMTTTPDATPPLGTAAPIAAQELIGGTVSVRG